MDPASFLGPNRPIFRWFLLLVSGRPSYQSLSPSISSTYVWTLGGSLVKTSQASLLGSAKKGLVTPGEHTVDGGRNPVNSPVEVGSLCHYLQGFLHARWLLGISEPSTVSHLAKRKIIDSKVSNGRNM